MMQFYAAKHGVSYLHFHTVELYMKSFSHSEGGVQREGEHHS